MGRECSTYGGKGEACTGFWVGKPEGDRFLGIPRLRLEDYLKSSGSGMWRARIGSNWLRIGTVGGHL
jgi:hypothetical protein